jgi:hypothetical protein
VDDDGLLVGRLADVEPEGVDPGNHRRLVGGDGMLWRQRRRSPVRDDDRA